MLRWTFLLALALTAGGCIPLVALSPAFSDTSEPLGTERTTPFNGANVVFVQSPLPPSDALDAAVTPLALRGWTSLGGTATTLTTDWKPHGGWLLRLIVVAEPVGDASRIAVRGEYHDPSDGETGTIRDGTYFRQRFWNELHRAARELGEPTLYARL